MFLLQLSALTAGWAGDDVVRTEIVTLSLKGGVPGYFIHNGDEVSEIRATTKGIGTPVTYRGPQVLAIYANRADAVVRQPDEAPTRPVMNVRLPPRQDRVLLVFSSPEGKEGGNPAVHAVGISTEGLKEGDYRIFNLSHQTVYAILDNRKATIHPGKPVDLSSPAWRTGTMDMEVKLGVGDLNKVREVYSSVWGHRPGRRTFLFVLDRPDEFRPVDIRRFHDTPGADAERREE